MERMLSGIKPTGKLTLGNYIGALKNFVKYQESYEMFIFIANLHTLTFYQDPKELKKNLKDALALYLACGLDEKKSLIFLQSDVMAQAQLGYILSCNTYLGELNRMTQYKDKIAKGENNLSAGFYTYPCLMAADILIYDPDYIPVGEDQKQHVELTRDIAFRFNNRFGDCFKVPKPLIEKLGSRIMNLNNPLKKMSKSENDKGNIYLLDDLKTIEKKIMSATTDSDNSIHYDKLNKPGISNLMTIMASLTDLSFSEIEAKYKGSGYGDFKKDVARVVCNEIALIQNRYNEIISSNRIDSILENSSIIVNKLANKKLNKVQRLLGIEIKKRK